MSKLLSGLGDTPIDYESDIVFTTKDGVSFRIEKDRYGSTKFPFTATHAATQPTVGWNATGDVNVLVKWVRLDFEEKSIEDTAKDLVESWKKSRNDGADYDDLRRLLTEVLREQAEQRVALAVDLNLHTERARKLDEMVEHQKKEITRLYGDLRKKDDDLTLSKKETREARSSLANLMATDFAKENKALQDRMATLNELIANFDRRAAQLNMQPGAEDERLSRLLDKWGVVSPIGLVDGEAGGSVKPIRRSIYERVELLVAKWSRDLDASDERARSAGEERTRANAELARNLEELKSRTSEIVDLKKKNRELETMSAEMIANRADGGDDTATPSTSTDDKSEDDVLEDELSTSCRTSSIRSRPASTTSRAW